MKYSTPGLSLTYMPFNGEGTGRLFPQIVDTWIYSINDNDSPMHSLLTFFFSGDLPPPSYIRHLGSSFCPMSHFVIKDWEHLVLLRPALSGSVLHL